jgi:hypothetical protein
VWTFKKISRDDKADTIFHPEMNQWRRKPAQPETDEAIRKKISLMLRYYSDYFTLVSKESAYFLPARVPMPFKYYQHDIQLTSERLNEWLPFFYDSEQAASAYGIMGKAMDEMGEDFPRSGNFVREYALYMKELAWYTTHPKTITVNN